MHEALIVTPAANRANGTIIVRSRVSASQTSVQPQIVATEGNGDDRFDGEADSDVVLSLLACSV